LVHTAQRLEKESKVLCCQLLPALIHLGSGQALLDSRTSLHCRSLAERTQFAINIARKIEIINIKKPLLTLFHRLNIEPFSCITIGVIIVIINVVHGEVQVVDEEAKKYGTAFVVALFVASPVGAWGQGEAVGRLEAVFGRVVVKRGGKNIACAVGTELFATDTLKVEGSGTAMLRFTDGSSVVAAENSELNVARYSAMARGKTRSASMLLDVLKGKLRFFFKKTDATVRTSNATIGVRGTTFFIDAQGASTQVVMVEGRVAVANLTAPEKVIEVGANQLTRVLEHAAPDVPVKVPPAVFAALSSAVKEVDLRDAGGAVQPPPSSNDNHGGEKSETKRGAKPAEGDGKLVVDPSGESTRVAPVEPTGVGAPGRSLPTDQAPTSDEEQEQGEAPAPAADALQTLNPAAPVEKAVEQLNTAVQRPIDAKGSATPRKLKIGVKTE
jgi:hypothetical protein